MSADRERPEGNVPRLRVAVVAYTEYQWDLRVRREAESLAQNGYAVHVISLRSHTGPSPAQLGGVHLHEVPLVARRGGRLRYAYQYAMFFFLSSALLLRLHLRRPFDVVHVHSLPDFQVLCALPLRVSRTAILLDLHEAMPEILAARFRLSSRAFLPRFASFLEGLSCRFADHVITVNDGIREAILSRGVPGNRVTSIYNATDAPMSVLPSESLRRELGLPQGRLLVHAGGINWERDLGTLLRAVARLRQADDVHVVLAGEGQPAYITELRGLAKNLGIQDRMHFVGKVSLEQAHALMALSSVGIVTLEENPLTELAWPVRVTEFVGLGKPLIVPRLRFLQSVLGDGAHYYNPGDPQSLAVELEAALGREGSEDPTVATAQLVCRQFEWKRMRDVFFSVYHTLEESHAG